MHDRLEGGAVRVPISADSSTIIRLTLLCRKAHGSLKIDVAQGTGCSTWKTRQLRSMPIEQFGKHCDIWQIQRYHKTIHSLARRWSAAASPTATPRRSTRMPGAAGPAGRGDGPDGSRAGQGGVAQPGGKTQLSPGQGQTVSATRRMLGIDRRSHAARLLYHVQHRIVRLFLQRTGDIASSRPGPVESVRFASTNSARLAGRAARVST